MLCWFLCAIQIKVGLVSETSATAATDGPDRLEDQSLNARGRALLMSKLLGQPGEDFSPA
jgi:hypothetical protein